MTLSAKKTKIVCTIGPASESRQTLEKMIANGMNVARLNFAHGDYQSHKRVMGNVRDAAAAVGQRVAILADLPGPKIRIGHLAQEPVELDRGQTFVLHTEEIEGDAHHVGVSLPNLPQVVKPGDVIFVNDGLVQLAVAAVQGDRVHCEVLVGGQLRSHKGVNLPGIDLGIQAFTDRDHEILNYALEQGADAVSQSFVQGPEDIEAVRQAAAAAGRVPFIVAKIERRQALEHVDAILEAADGIMVARGDLGVEIPIAEIAVAQKRLIHRANLAGKPVITATQMLESMVENLRPTRAEVTDVANAILDGTDCVMLSEESAMGICPEEAVAVMARIAAATEAYRSQHPFRRSLVAAMAAQDPSVEDLIALSVQSVVERLTPTAVMTPTDSGTTARCMSRFRSPVWIVAPSRNERTCQELQFSYGVHAVRVEHNPANWEAFVRDWLVRHEMAKGLVILTHGFTASRGGTNHMEIIDFGPPAEEVASSGDEV
jgi:pyruvate kinase